MKRTAAILALGLLATLLPPAAAEPIGEWLTDPDEALELAQRTKSPILAVAMDHG